MNGAAKVFVHMKRVGGGVSRQQENTRHTGFFGADGLQFPEEFPNDSSAGMYHGIFKKNSVFLLNLPTIMSIMHQWNSWLSRKWL